MHVHETCARSTPLGADTVLLHTYTLRSLQSQNAPLREFTNTLDTAGSMYITCVVHARCMSD